MILQNKEGRSSVDLSSGIKITPVYVDASPRPLVPTPHCGSGDQNSDDNLATDTMDNDGSDIETDVDLSIVGTSLQKQQEDAH